MSCELLEGVRPNGDSMRTFFSSISREFDGYFRARYLRTHAPAPLASVPFYREPEPTRRNRCLNNPGISPQVGTAVGGDDALKQFATHLASATYRNLSCKRIHPTDRRLEAEVSSNSLRSAVASGPSILATRACALRQCGTALSRARRPFSVIRTTRTRPSAESGSLRTRPLAANGLRLRLRVVGSIPNHSAIVHTGASHNLAKLVVHQVAPRRGRTVPSLAVYADCNLAASRDLVVPPTSQK